MPKTKEISKLLQYVFLLDSLGNVPYFSNSLSKILLKYLSEDKITVVEDEFALYVKIGNPKKPPIVIDTHLDHPGFVIKEDNTVISLGSFLNSKMINDAKLPKKLPVGFYSSTGHLITTGFLYNISASNNQIVGYYQTDNNLSLPANTQVMPIVETGLQKDLLSLRSVDNLATVFVCLNLIERLKYSKDLNLTFIFTKLEEIYQLSATGIAKRASTPFEKIYPHTPIIVLEVAPVLTNTQAKNGDLAVAVSENIFSALNEKSKTLSLLKNVCDTNKIKLHFSKLNSHGNSIAYRLVLGNSETMCLHVGSFNRHNLDENGEFTAESVYLKSLINLRKVVTQLVKTLSADYPQEAAKIKLSNHEQRKRNQLISAYTRAYPRLKLNKLYPKSLYEYFYFGYYSIISRFI